MENKLESIDKNFIIQTIEGRDAVFHNAKDDPFQIYGAYMEDTYDEPYRRLPHLEGVNGGVNWLSYNTAGIRVRFTTDSPFIAIRVLIDGACHMGHMTLTGSCGFDMYEFNNGREKYLKTFVPWTGITDGRDSFECFADLSQKKMRSLTLNFPLYNRVKKLEIGIAPDAIIKKGADYKDIAPIVYYGSSITQGGCASRPGNSYEALISHEINVDHINLGFSGACVAEPEMAEYIASLPMSAFVYDYDYNAPDAEYLEETHEPFFKLIRKTYPNLPIIILSAPYPAEEGNDRTRRDIIKRTYENALANGDRNVYFIDGGSIFDGDFRDSCTVDGVHPNDAGFFRMASSVLAVIKKALNI